MTAPAIIAGSLVDVRNVNQHKCVRLIIDVPAEHALKVIEAFAWPTMVSPVAVAVARLTVPEKTGEGVLCEGQSGDGLPRATSTAHPPPVPPADKATGRAPKAWNDLPLSQQAGIRCNEPAFWKFLREQFKPPFDTLHIADADAASKCVRLICGLIASRSDLKPDGMPGRAWQQLDAQYRAWQREAEVVPA